MALLLATTVHEYQQYTGCTVLSTRIPGFYLRPGLYSRPGVYSRPGYYSRKYGIQKSRKLSDFGSGLSKDMHPLQRTPALHSVDYQQKTHPLTLLKLISTVTHGPTEPCTNFQQMHLQTYKSTKSRAATKSQLLCQQSIQFLNDVTSATDHENIFFLIFVQTKYRNSET